MTRKWYVLQKTTIFSLFRRLITKLLHGIRMKQPYLPPLHLLNCVGVGIYLVNSFRVNRDIEWSLCSNSPWNNCQMYSSYFVTVVLFSQIRIKTLCCYIYQFHHIIKWTNAKNGRKWSSSETYHNDCSKRDTEDTLVKLGVD